MNERDYNARAARIREAIDNGPLAMSEIADTMGVARTSVLNWKKKGNINLDNLRGFAQLTGFRFWWLAFGEGPKTYGDSDDSPSQSPLADIAKASPEHAKLVECVAHLTAARVLTPALAEGITCTLNAVAAAKKD
ncbi:helix-turn-helix domain-containing protein [Marinobacter hydrocarbonoclasticus]|uniref:helix-turn-helix domain-containing protein n=1 Tax=Marinobacter nauticus TaxID=2743 RepID=UPI001A8E4AEF|nr:helix-turn-helix domain-containing protein [Marinobacter nauticus]MBN8237775.1 helix-turn-helix domain-containing protein [Marinobacter nauticus]